jgi:hypothetical protein
MRNSNTIPIRRELKEKFIRDLTQGEQRFFLKKAREAITQRGYPVCEDLFHYCYFLTMRERLSGIDSYGGEGYMRFLLVETRRDTEQEVRFYEERLESRKQPHPDIMAYALIERALNSGTSDRPDQP